MLRKIKYIDFVLIFFFGLQTEQEYVDSGSPHGVNTAQAMLALLYAGQV